MLAVSRETFMTVRYALYYVPGPGGPWWSFGSHWLGRCAATGRRLPQAPIAGVEPAVFHALTAAPRRYGFHATLKPPFRLARDARLADLIETLEQLCEKQVAFRLPRLEVAELDGFLALVPAAREPRLAALSAACVRGLDRFRAPPAAAEMARRRRGSMLPPREDLLLRRWGYPYVLDRFRFHLSLTGNLRETAPATIEALRGAAEAATAELACELTMVDSVCVLEEVRTGADLQIVHRARFRRRGRLVYVVGPSGSGKDSLLAWVRNRLPEDSRVMIARRTITRPAQTGGEAHLTASETQFDAMRARGEFALHWRANGQRYGIGREIEDWLAAGATVVVNGSREHLAAAQAGFPQLETVYVSAPPPLLHMRLARRGRENPREVSDRVLRNSRLSNVARAAALSLENDGPIEIAGARLAAFLAGENVNKLS